MQEISIKICRWITTILIFLVKYLTASGCFVARYANPAPPTDHDPTLENARPNPASIHNSPSPRSPKTDPRPRSHVPQPGGHPGYFQKHDGNSDAFSLTKTIGKVMIA